MNSRDNDKNLYDIMDMSEDEFADYMIEEYNKKPSDSEIIMNSGKTIENLITEINAYQDKLVFLAYKYELSLNNKAAFILKLCDQKENIQELMPLLSCFICKPDYLFELKNKKVSIKNEGRLAEYLLLKEDIDTFEKRIYEIHSSTEKYNNILKRVKEDSSNISEAVSSEDKKLLIKLYKQYIQVKKKHKEKSLIEYENKCIDENIEQIHNFAMETVEKQKLYSLIVFQLLTRYRSKISKKMELVNCSNIMNYKKYVIDKNNGKNFNTYGNYISLFLELVDNFSDICDISLCMYGFEKTSNLVEWLFRNTLYRDIFHYSIYSLIESTYGSIFYEESIFWSDNNLKVKSYFDFEAQDDDNKSNKGEYLSELIESKLSDNEVVDYLNEYAKSQRHAAKYIKKFVYEFLEINNCTLTSMGDEGYIFLTFERELQEKADYIIKQKIMEVLK
ncbi:hypothetical protein [Clostridium sp. DJ247]|uniref:hypothetical protein n=1 Tax=Clostridium sp. DJ247 TaxID=2726188 RepID=UPI0016243F22|nr:hypothetical protein [Clostridium sp. DJ247]MBC2579361.1 hypothetical protein [Clostridium sp. DJ247]